jgi:hypothetical protein
MGNLDYMRAYCAQRPLRRPGLMRTIYLSYKLDALTLVSQSAFAQSNSQSSKDICAWHGAGACSKWANDADADNKKNGITDESVTLSKPRHIDITADRAYVVVPATYSYKEKGRWLRSPARYGRWL